MNRETPTNYAPSALPQFIELVEGEFVEVHLGSFDANQDTLTFAIQEPPTLGNLIGFDPVTGVVTYLNLVAGNDSFSFTVSDAILTSEPAHIVFRIENTIFADGFETGDTSRWGSTHGRFSPLGQEPSTAVDQPLRPQAQPDPSSGNFWRVRTIKS